MSMLDKVLSKPVKVIDTDFELPPPEKHEGEYEWDFGAGGDEDPFEDGPDFDDEDESEAEKQETEIPEASEEQELKWRNLYKNSLVSFPYRVAGIELDSRLELLSSAGNWVGSAYELIDLLVDKEFQLATPADFDEKYAEALERHGYSR